jgi:16S rRNA (adenine(1408)-N(1))-methyltransferase
MEIIHDKDTASLDAAALAVQLRGYHDVLIDLGTGDGRYVRYMAAERPTWFIVGVDACREQVRRASRRAPRDVLFAIANAYALPPELHDLATEITINFPWGSLLTGLVEGDPVLLAGVRALARPGAGLHVRLNAGALAAIGWELAAGTLQVRDKLRASAWDVGCPSMLDAADLRRLPTIWAKRLAFGRDPRAMELRGTYAAPTVESCGMGRSVAALSLLPSSVCR